MNESETEAADPLRKERRERADAQLIAFMESEQIDGIIRVLPDKVPGRPPFEEVTDAVYQAVASFYQRALGGGIGSVGGYVYRAARNILLKAADARMRSTPFDDDLEHQDERAGPKRDLRPALVWLEHVIEQWPTEHVRTVTLIVVRAALAGQPVSARDIVDHVRATGDEIGEAAARTWKSRGIRRLAAEVAAKGITLDDLLDGDHIDEERDDETIVGQDRMEEDEE